MLFVLSKIFLTISILSVIFFIPVHAQNGSLLTISTSKNSYNEGDTIVISGKVSTIILSTPVTLQVFYKGNLVEIAQINVAKDGTYTHTIIAQGPLWKNSGEYIARALYSQGNIAETTFQFFNKGSAPETVDVFEVNTGKSGTFDIKYTIRGGTVKNMIIDSEIFALVVIIDSTSDGQITLELPRSFIDAKKTDGNDDTYIILIDGIEVQYQETKTDTQSRTIKIEFDQGDSDIEVIGTFIIPEFGIIASLVLIIGIMATIIMRSRFSILKIN